MAVTKERNILTIDYDKMSAPVLFDINTATISRKGKTCTTTPAYSKQALREYVCENHSTISGVVSLLYELVCAYGTRAIPMYQLSAYAPRFQLADKFDAIGYKTAEDYTIMQTLRNAGVEQVEELNKNFKSFSKYYSTHPNATYDNWMLEMSEELIKQSYKFPEEYHVIPALDYFIGQYGDEFDEKYRPIIVYWLVRGVFNYFYDGTPVNRFSDSRWAANMKNALKRMIQMCEELNTMPEKSDFFRQYGTVQQNYRAFRESADSEQMKDYQQNAPLAFEDDDLIVVIPTTPTEFSDEAQYQQNCVFSYYMCRVIEHTTHVVFIRHKNDINTPYITCEVDNRGCISQYLTRFNNRVTDKIGSDFYKKYADHLSKNWNK